MNWYLIAAGGILILGGIMAIVWLVRANRREKLAEKYKMRVLLILKDYAGYYTLSAPPLWQETSNSWKGIILTGGIVTVPVENVLVIETYMSTKEIEVLLPQRIQDLQGMFTFAPLNPEEETDESGKQPRNSDERV